MASIDSGTRRAVALLSCAIAISLVSAARAQPATSTTTYKITDDKGRVQYTDHMPPDAVNRGVVELNKEGMTKKVIEAAPTPEQRKVIEEREEKRLDAEKQLTQKRNQENALLASYTSESDIDIAKRRNLALVGASILSAEARIKSLQRRSAALEKEKQYYENKPIPDKLKREMAALAAEIPKQYELIAQKNEEALNVDMKYNKQKEQFRELKAQLAREAAETKKQ